MLFMREISCLWSSQDMFDDIYPRNIDDIFTTETRTTNSKGLFEMCIQ